MKKVYSLMLLLLGLVWNATAQTSSDSKWVEKPQRTVSRNQTPSPDTYQITKNETGKPVSHEVLASIHTKRKARENFLWKVSPQLEILIYSRESIRKK